MSRDDLKLSYLTVDQPGIGGVIKQYDEDFLVEEMPRYEACGEGTHIYFTIEKQGLTTLAAIRNIARALHRKPQEIGYAGMKDAHGVTRQRLSLEHIDPSKIESLELSRIRILSTQRHGNKIKLGHLAGNRFVIKIRRAKTDDVSLVNSLLTELEKRGVPNYFGPQRFGSRGDNAQVGRAVLRDDFDEAFSIMLGKPSEKDNEEVNRARALFDQGQLEQAAHAWPRNMSDSARLCYALHQAKGDAKRAWRSVNHTIRKLYFSSVQSELFNQVLTQRVVQLDQLQTGDVAWKHANGACFSVEDAALERSRCVAFEISPTGPLFGKNMKETHGEPAQLEQAVLTDSGLAKDELRSRDGVKLDGARRPLRIPLAEWEVKAGKDERGAYISLLFSLPPGSYATSVTREVCKSSK